MNPSNPASSTNPVTMPGPRKRAKAAWVAGTLTLLTLCGFSQDEKMALIRGQFASERIPEEISLNTVKNGAVEKHSSVKVAKDGSFGFYFQPEYTGFYTVGERGRAARLYMSPGKTVQLTMEDDLFAVNADDRQCKSMRFVSGSIVDRCTRQVHQRWILL